MVSLRRGESFCYPFNPELDSGLLLSLPLAGFLKFQFIVSA